MLFLYIYTSWEMSFPQSTKDMFQAVINISAIAVGFLATAYSFILALDTNRPVIAFLKDADVYDLMIKYLMSAIRFSFLTTIVAVIWLLLDDFKTSQWYLYGFTAWLFLAIAAICACQRSIYLFSRIALNR